MEAALYTHNSGESHSYRVICLCEFLFYFILTGAFHNWSQSHYGHGHTPGRVWCGTVRPLSTKSEQPTAVSTTSLTMEVEAVIHVIHWIGRQSDHKCHPPQIQWACHRKQKVEWEAPEIRRCVNREVSLDCLSRSLCHSSPIPNKPHGFCGCKAPWQKKREKKKMGSPHWHVSMFSIHLQKLLRLDCPGHAGVKGSDQADRLAGKATITNGSHLGWSQMLGSLRLPAGTKPSALDHWRPGGEAWKEVALSNQSGEQ